MRYVKDNTIFNIEDIRKENPNMSIPDGSNCETLGYNFLEETEMPFKDGFYTMEDIPVDNKQTWKFVPIEVQVPVSITRLQAKLELHEIGRKAEVESYLATNPKAQIYWTDAELFYRTDEVLLNMVKLLNLTETEVDNLFINASKR